MSTDRYDIIIIGTGAGGGTILHRLAPSGLRILVLERGGFLPREKENWDPREVCTNGRYLAQDTWRDREGNPFRPFTHYWVGGNTKVYGAALLRMRESDFGAVRHSSGISPAWPIGYDEFEPYYTEAERLYHVHGEAGADPTEPRRSGPYPHRAVAFEPRMQEIAEGLRAQGLRPFPCALGVRMPRSAPERSAMRVLSCFDGYPDLTETKADSEVVCVTPALSHHNVTIRTRARVVRLETDRTGREVRAVVVEREGALERYSSDIVVLACGAVNSAAILLQSASDAHPTGLANGSGLVGRNYMCHNNGMVIAITGRENPSQFQKAFALADYYHGAPDSQFPLGLIQLMGKPDPDFLESLTREHLPSVPKDELWKHTVDFFITAEDLPDPDNRVTVDPDRTIRLTYRENNREAYDRLRAKLIEAFDRIEMSESRESATYVGPKLGISGVSHQNGTLRFGTDPAASVLDVDCKAHELDNLYVADSSFFPSSGAVNPSLTIMANALRVGDRILERLGKGAVGALARSTA